MRPVLLLLPVFLFLSSCSKLSVGVYWADTFAVSQADDYFTLSSEQKEAAKKDFQAAFRQVRLDDFPKFAEILEGVAGEVERSELKAARLEHWDEKTRKALKTAVQRFEPLGQKLVAQQASKGFTRFDKEFQEAQEKRGKKLETPADRLKQAKKRIERVIDETVGSLDKEQEARVELLLRENPLSLEQESRAHVFARFQAARIEEKTRAEFLRKYFFDWDSLQKPEFVAARDAYHKKSRELMLAILGSASEKQKKNLIENFRARAAELRKLAVVK